MSKFKLQKKYACYFFNEFNVFDYKRNEYDDQEDEQQYMFDNNQNSEDIHKLFHLKIFKRSEKQ